MKQININYKSSSESFVEAAYPGDAGTDLIAESVEYDFEKDCIVYTVDLQLEIPEGFVGFILPRSSIFKTDLMLTNSVGVIDSGFRGKLSAKFKVISPYFLEAESTHFQDLLNEGKFPIYTTKKDHKKGIVNHCTIYKPGDKIAQIVFLPYATPIFNKVNTLSESIRGEKGFGSSGN